MANVTVSDATATEALTDDATLNPTVTSAADTGNKKIVHITLEIENVDLDIDTIFDALDTEYAVVQSPKSSMSHGVYIFNIGPA